ncbi:ankyrin repeat-containing domain protein [Coprinopsis sp. MPI-PUGE-AT-0042]|nr:ankyrin repeat-containing domain protein [Coprinopsis sp. MPI-PUGE-AT-0042]
MHIHAHYHSNPDVAGGPSKSTSHYFETPQVDVMAILKPVSNYRKIQQDTFSKATPKTGEWMLKHEKIAVWQDPTSSLDMMCGSGIPGAGKTVLSSIMINHAEERARELGSPVCIGFIYLRYSDNAGLTVRHCLEVLVKQSLQQHSNLLRLAEEVYAPHVRLEGEPPEGELLRLLQGFTRAVTSTTYFLDALDEAPPAIQIDLVGKLASTGAKLFITSRPFKALEERFPNAHHFSIAAQDSDLELHINSQLDRGQELWKVLEQGGASFRADLVASIKEKCGGMFLHASLQLAALQHCASVRNVRETLATFPPKIEDVYRQTWTPVCLETHKFDPERIVHIDTIVLLCRGLLVVDKETELVRLVHYTAKEPLERLMLETFPRLHSLMALLCMGRLIHHGFQNWQGSPENLNDATEVDPLLTYAYHAWSKHALNSLNDPSMVTKVKGFVRGCRSFPLFKYYDYVEDLLGPLHVVGFFHLPISLAGGPLINALDPNRRTKWKKFTPLHLACRDPSHFSTLQELVSLRLIDVNAVNKRGETPLICAAESGTEDAVKHLLAHPKIRLDLTDQYGLTVFTSAAEKGNETVVKPYSPIHQARFIQLMAGGEQQYLGRASVATWPWSSSSFPIPSPRSVWRITTDHILSLAQDDIQLADKDGRTPLSWASSGGDEETVKILLACPGTDINQVDNYGRTPLSWASEHSQEGVVKVLLANPLTNVNLADADGWTPLIRASWLSHNVDSMKALLAHPQINVNLQNNKGQIALIRAISWYKLETVKVLLAHPDIKVNLPDREGRTPLIWATMKEWRSAGTEEITQVLLAHPQTDVNLANNQGRTALSWASQLGREVIVKHLLEHPQIGASHRPDNQGRTPLGWASKEGHNKIAELLLAHSPIQPQSEPEPEPEPELDRGLGSMLDSAVQKVHRLWR